MNKKGFAVREFTGAGWVRRQIVVKQEEADQRCRVAAQSGLWRVADAKTGRVVSIWRDGQKVSRKDI